MSFKISAHNHFNTNTESDKPLPKPHTSIPRRDSRVSFADTNGQLDSASTKYDDEKETDYHNGRLSMADLISNAGVTNQSLLQKYTSCRWVTTYMCFAVILLTMTLRQCMSIAIVCMAGNDVTEDGDVNVTQSLLGNQSDIVKTTDVS